MPVAAYALRIKRQDRAKVAERFWANVEKRGRVECWEWTGCKTERGYGRFRYGDRIQKAPRVAYALLLAPVPSGLVIDHLCANPGCVNPSHLDLVTAEENLSRHFRKQTHCKHGHEFTPENTYIHPSRGTRRCKKCHREQGAQRARNKAARRRIADHYGLPVEPIDWAGGVA